MANWKSTKLPDFKMQPIPTILEKQSAQQNLLGPAFESRLDEILKGFEALKQQME
jgi:hypothetical protein